MFFDWKVVTYGPVTNISLDALPFIVMREPRNKTDLHIVLIFLRTKIEQSLINVAILEFGEAIQEEVIV